MTPKRLTWSSGTGMTAMTLAPPWASETAFMAGSISLPGTSTSPSST